MLRTTVHATSLAEMETRPRGIRSSSQDTEYMVPASHLDYADTDINSLTAIPSGYPLKALPNLRSEISDKLKPRRGSAPTENAKDGLDASQDDYFSCTRDDSSSFYSADSGDSNSKADTIFPRPPAFAAQTSHFRLPELDTEIMRSTHPLDNPVTYLPLADDGCLVVREFLFNVLTLSDWAISEDHPSAVRATVENWIGPGYHLVERFEKNDLQDICPKTVYTKSHLYGHSSERRVSESVRKAVACCVRREILRQLERKEQLKRDLEHISRNSSPYKTYTQDFGGNERGGDIFNDSESSHAENTARQKDPTKEESAYRIHELSNDHPKSAPRRIPNTQEDITPHSMPRQTKITKYQGVSKLDNLPRRQKIFTADGQAFISQVPVPPILPLDQDDKQTKADRDFDIYGESEEARNLGLPKAEYGITHDGSFFSGLQQERETNPNPVPYRTAPVVRSRTHNNRRITHSHASLSCMATNGNALIPDIEEEPLEQDIQRERTYETLCQGSEMHREEIDRSSRSGISLAAPVDENTDINSISAQTRKPSRKSFLSFRQATPSKATQSTGTLEIDAAEHTGSKWDGPISSICHPELTNQRRLNEKAHKDARRRKGFSAIFFKNPPEFDSLPPQGSSIRDSNAGREGSRKSRIFSLSSTNLPMQVPEVGPELGVRRVTQTPADTRVRNRRSWMSNAHASSLALSPVEESTAEAHRRKRSSWHMLSRPEPSFAVSPTSEPTSVHAHGQVAELPASQPRPRDWPLTFNVVEVTDSEPTIQESEVSTSRTSEDFIFPPPQREEKFHKRLSRKVSRLLRVSK
ncbi:hypothetical protein AOQ84DRAFT_371562 [Glonium stellatum]|uniref:Uncharacterized protein n=1 Tax=Glonium stellatum TaxID=574774 RepID=A0A8E2FC64_9PEZI|nr:hypothetical protein AOQ84DRAFT_371562 [Glonium stellatum]